LWPGQETPRPPNRVPERPLTGGSIPRALCQERQPAIQSPQQLGWRKHGDPCRRQLQRKWKPIKLTADFEDRAHISLGEPERWVHFQRPLDEEPDRWH